MTELTIVRNNLMNQPGYSPYCGSDLCLERNHPMDERWPRTRWNGEQFVCPRCGWVSQFPIDFIDRYKEKWGLDDIPTVKERVWADKLLQTIRNDQFKFGSYVIPVMPIEGMTDAHRISVKKLADLLEHQRHEMNIALGVPEDRQGGWGYKPGELSLINAASASSSAKSSFAFDLFLKSLPGMAVFTPERFPITSFHIDEAPKWKGKKKLFQKRNRCPNRWLKITARK